MFPCRKTDVKPRKYTSPAEGTHQHVLLFRRPMHLGEHQQFKASWIHFDSILFECTFSCFHVLVFESLPIIRELRAFILGQWQLLGDDRDWWTCFFVFNVKFHLNVCFFSEKRFQWTFQRLPPASTTHIQKKTLWRLSPPVVTSAHGWLGWSLWSDPGVGASATSSVIHQSNELAKQTMSCFWKLVQWFLLTKASVVWKIWNGSKVHRGKQTARVAWSEVAGPPK